MLTDDMNDVFIIAGNTATGGQRRTQVSVKGRGKEREGGKGKSES